MERREERAGGSANSTHVTLVSGTSRFSESAKNNMDPIRIGIIGLGGICRARHLPGLRRIDGVEIRAVSNRTPESNRRAAEEFDIPVTCEFWEDLVVREDLDAILVGTWPYLHHPVATAALKAGKHVFCQARMAMNFQEAKEMNNRWRDTDCVAMLCPVPFGLSVDATVARLMAEDAIGELRLVTVRSMSSAYLSPDAPMDWRKDHRLSGRNMLTLGMYVEVIHRWFGGTQFVRAESETFVDTRVDEDGERVEVKIPDQVLFTATMEKKFLVQYTFSAVSPQPCEEIIVFGTRGTLRYDVMGDTLYMRPLDGQEEVAPIREEDAYDVSQWRVEQDFIDAIREGKDYHPNFEDGMRYMQVIDAVYISSQYDRRVDVDDIR